jgi:hypothetical protein
MDDYYSNIERVDVGIDQLATYVFFENKQNKIIHLDLHGIENTKDLFCFLFDLFCKGLVTLYGNERRQVDFVNVSMQDILYVVDRLKYAKVRCILTEKTIEQLAPLLSLSPEEQDLISPAMVLYTSMDLLKKMPDSLPNLTDYSFTVMIHSKLYTIQFDLYRVYN